MRRARLRSRRSRQGNTLLEVLLATAILAGTLVPALRLMRDSMIVSREIEANGLVETYCVGKLEQQLALAAGTWTTGIDQGDFAGDGQSQLRFVAVRADDSASGGIPNRLMAVTVSVWYDRDGNLAIDPGEPIQSMNSKVAKMAAY